MALDESLAARIRDALARKKRRGRRPVEGVDRAGGEVRREATR